MLKTIPSKPMMDGPELKAFAALLAERQPRRFLEWGSGISTIYWPKQFPEILWTAIEHDEEWFNLVRKQLEPQVTLIWLKLPEYYDLARHHLGKFDLILVDGAPKSRQQCLAKARSMLNPGGSVILHDASHPPYAEAARANFGRITVLCPPNAQGKRGLWLLDDPREFTV